MEVSFTRMFENHWLYGSVLASRTASAEGFSVLSVWHTLVDYTCQTGAADTSRCMETERPQFGKIDLIITQVTLSVLVGAKD